LICISCQRESCSCPLISQAQEAFDLSNSIARTGYADDEKCVLSGFVDRWFSSLIQDDWATYRARVEQTYGYLPQIMVWMEPGEMGLPSPLHAFMGLNLENQIKMLNLLYGASIKENFTFVFPLHLISFVHSILYRYDALQEGTYPTIKQMLNNESRVVITTASGTETQGSTTSLTSESSAIFASSNVSLNSSSERYWSYTIVGLLIMTITVGLLAYTRRLRKKA